MERFFERALTPRFLEKLQPNKVLVLLGARRTGKTEFIRYIAKNHLHEPYLLLNGEDALTQSMLGLKTIENYKGLTGNYKILVIDEAQKIPDVGHVLKLMIDNIDGLKIIVTGSSVFDMANKMGEPLTGRKYTFHLFPFAQMELSNYENPFETRARLEERLVYGCYPELVSLTGNQQKADYLSEIINSYLLKDILEFDGIRNSAKIMNLLRLIAYQTGKEVSLDELGKQLGISRNTVERHLDLLSKVFIVYKLEGFSRNLRSEITKTNRWYFYDNGIRNTIIANHNPLAMRNDVGELWENYVLSERVKYQHYKPLQSNNYFWRTYSQQEIDWIEERGGELFAYEMKWNTHKKAKTPPAWQKAYPGSLFEVISPDTYLNWIR